MKRLVRWLSSPDGVLMFFLGGTLLGGSVAIPQINDEWQVVNSKLLWLGVILGAIAVLEAIAIGIGLGMFPHFLPRLWDKDGNLIDSSRVLAHEKLRVPKRGPLEFLSKTSERILMTAWITILPPTVHAATLFSHRQGSGSSVLIPRLEVFVSAVALLSSFLTTMWRIKMNWGHSWTSRLLRKWKGIPFSDDSRRVAFMKNIINREVSRYWRWDIRLLMLGGGIALFVGIGLIGSPGTEWIPGIAFVVLGLAMSVAFIFEDNRLNGLRAVLLEAQREFDIAEYQRQLEQHQIWLANEALEKEKAEKLRQEREEYERREIRRKGLIPLTRIEQLGLALPRLPGGSREFEEVVRDWLIAWGDTNVEVTPQTRDGGFDVFSDRCVAQCKYHIDRPVGRPEVQQLKGVASTFQNYWPLYFSWIDGYTNDAYEWANEAGVALFAFNRNMEFESVNTWASDYQRLLLDLY